MLYEKKISEIIRLIYGGKVLGKKYMIGRMFCACATEVAQYPP
jgi:hypothetical protein